MVLKLFFDISTSFRFSKDQCECTLHSEAPPWYNLRVLSVLYTKTAAKCMFYRKRVFKCRAGVNTAGYSICVCIFWKNITCTSSKISEKKTFPCFPLHIATDPCFIGSASIPAKNSQKGGQDRMCNGIQNRWSFLRFVATT